MTLEEIIARDQAASQRMTRYNGNRLVRSFAWLTARSGDSVVWLLISAILLWLRRPEGWPLLITIAVTAFLTALAKGIFKRERPSEKWAIATDKYAFPSGHAARAGAVAVALAVIFPPYAFLCFLWAALVALSRVILARHYLSDVVGGLLLGVVVSLVLQFFFISNGLFGQ
jgi:undecaprenyl-diphosphatase